MAIIIDILFLLSHGLFKLALRLIDDLLQGDLEFILILAHLVLETLLLVQ